MSDKILLKKIFFLPIHSSRPKSKARKLLDPKARKPLIFQGGIFMSLVINHNLMAMNANRNLASAYGNLSTSVSRLSSGLRITTAADDAAGLAIRELMRADIASLNQGVRNANDAISMIQTADGALGVIDEKLIRMKELATQAATGTYNSDQRLIIDSEYQQMASEITRIANATDFNGIYLLNGNLSSSSTGVSSWAGTHDGSGLASTGPLKIHFGTGNDSAEDYYYIAIGNSTASALGVGNASDATTANGSHGVASGGYSISTQQGAQQALAALNAAITSKDNIRASLGALQNRLENTITNLQIQAENLQAAESRISDADIATEMTNFVRNQILTQSAVAMLSQANSLPQMALQLMGA
jgi:flagellin